MRRWRLALLVVQLAGCRRESPASGDAHPATSGAVDPGAPGAPAARVAAPPASVAAARGEPSAGAASAPPGDLAPPLVPRPPPGPFARTALDRLLANADDAATFWESKGAAWIDARVTKARAGRRETVRVVLVHRGPWGCSCPEHYLGVAAAVNPTNRWILPTFGPEATPPDLVPAAPDAPQPDALMLVEGEFDGKVEHVRYDEETYELARFAVRRLRPPRGDDWLPRVLDPRDAGP